VHRGLTSGVMVSVLASSLVDRGLTGGVMVSVLASSLLDRGFIGGVMVRRARLESGRSWVHRWCND
jgi:coenzyme F420-reducing hydrogenase beta subunit